MWINKREKEEPTMMSRTLSKKEVQNILRVEDYLANKANKKRGV